MAKTVTEYRAAFGRCTECAHKQIGLRRLREIERMRDHDAQHAMDLAGSLPSLLAHAETITERDAERARR